MLQTLIIIALIVALSIALLGVRLFVGKPFVHTHIDGNAALNQKGIHCVHTMDRNERRANPHAVSERRSKD